MDEKLRIEIDYILAEVANHSNRYSDEDDAFRAIEQAFRDAGYRKLPSEIDVARLHHIIRRHVSFSEVDDEIILDDYAIAHELLKLLGEKP